MSVTEQFMDDSARAAIRALRDLEQTAIMLERRAPECFPEVSADGKKHFVRVMMESAAEAIRQAWADAIKDAENSGRANADHLVMETCARVCEEQRSSTANIAMPLTNAAYDEACRDCAAAIRALVVKP